MDIKRRLAAVFLLTWAMFSTSGNISAQDATTIEADAPANWLVYKGNLQRNGQVQLNIGAPPNLLWRYSTDLEPKSYDSTPLVVGPSGQRRIYIAVDKFLICLEGETGAQLWRSKELQRPITSPITLLPQGEEGDVILAITSSGQLNALRTSDGGQAWQVPATAPVQNIAPVVVNTADGERIILALATGKLTAYTTRGLPDTNWEVRLGSFAASPTCTPALSKDGTHLYIPTQDKKIFVVDVLGAKVAYTINLDSAVFDSPAISQEGLYAVSGTTLLGMKLRTGQTQWRFDVKSSLGSPAARAATETAPATVFVGARNGKFYGINAATGARLWEADLADSVTGSPVVARDMIIVGTRNGMLYGIAPETGKINWRYRLFSERLIEVEERERRDNSSNDGSGQRSRTRRNNQVTGGDRSITVKEVNHTFGVTSNPAVVDGNVYVLGDNAALYAFASAPFDAQPPQVKAPMLSIPNSAGKPTLMRLDTAKPLLVPGRTPVQLVLEVVDAGSGVNPDSIQVFLNNVVLPRTSLAPFADATGKLLVTLAESKNNVALNLEDGLFTVQLKASDYRGNELTYNANFLVDNTIAPPAAPAPEERNNDRR